MNQQTAAHFILTSALVPFNDSTGQNFLKNANFDSYLKKKAQCMLILNTWGGVDFVLLSHLLLDLLYRFVKVQ